MTSLPFRARNDATPFLINSGVLPRKCRSSDKDPHSVVVEHNKFWSQILPKVKAMNNSAQNFVVIKISQVS